jgi:hypothetical protein
MKKIILLLSFMILPYTVNSSPNLNCNQLPEAYLNTITKLNEARDFAQENVNILSGPGYVAIYAVTSQHALRFFNDTINKLQEAETAVNSATNGYSAGNAYIIHNTIREASISLWRANHWASLSYVYDKEAAAKSAMVSGLASDKLVSTFHDHSLQCYVHDF